MKGYYAARAPYYDDVYDKPERRADIGFLKSWLPETFAGRSVLEIACGTGYWTQHIAPAAASMVATDGVQEPLEIARSRPGTSEVRFLLSDAYALPEDLGHFDAAFAGLWLSHVPKQKRAEFVASLHRHLNPGAKVVLLDNSETQCRDLPVTAHDEHGNTYQDRQLRDGSAHRVLKNFPTENELRTMIEGHGRNPVYHQLEHFWLFNYESV
jgi:demethylmenaquinone methyltransferase/2-methoxy-6-polyprenyl-1,4-benzoquinol methylase